MDFNLETLVVVLNSVLTSGCGKLCDGSCQRIYMMKMKMSRTLGFASIIGMYVELF